MSCEAVMHRFDYLFLKEAIPAGFLQTTGIIYDLRAREELRKSEHADSFAALKQAAMIDSVSASNAIEGIVTTKKRMQEIVLKQSAPESHDEREIIGYRNALEGIYEQYNQMKLTEGQICNLHEQILAATSIEAGQYKPEDNLIQQRDREGNTRIRFVPVPAKETKKAMEQMLLAYAEARQEAQINRLLLNICLVLDFLCIHPFTDGNGRVSRLLTSFLLLRDGFDVGRYISIDKKLKEYLGNYYETLKLSSDGWHENNNTYIPFMTFMLQILYKCYKELDQKFVEGKISAMPKSEQVAFVLKNSYTPVSKEEISERLPDISITTIERVLGRMVKDGAIEKIGSYKDARYRAL